MDRDPIEQIFQRLERPVEPSAEFAQSLLIRLVNEMERPLVTRVPLSVQQPWLRRLVLGGAALALAAIVGTFLAIFLPGSSGPSPALAVIEKAIDNFANVPPFRATVFYDQNPEGVDGLGIPQGATSLIELSHAGQAGFRRVVLAEDPQESGDFVLGGQGSFVVWDGGEQIGFYLADENTFHSFPATRDFNFLGEFSWDASFPDWENICQLGGSEVLADEQIAGRPARHVRCGDLRGGFWELWVDAETGLMLKIIGTLPSDDFRPGTSPEGGFEVRSLEYGPAFPADTFKAAAPPGARDLAAEREEALRKIPPFRATFTQRASLAEEDIASTLPDTDWIYVHTIWYRDENSWRREILEDSLPRSADFSSWHRGGAGSFEVWDGEQIGVYNAVENWFQIRQDAAAGQDSSPLLDLRSTSDRTYLDECEALPDEQIAGRPAQHFRCEHSEEWIDAETGLTLKLVTDENFEIEVTSIEYNPVFPPGIFEFVPPAGAKDLDQLQEDPYNHVDLVQGQVAPSWSGPLLADGTFHLDDSRGRPILVFFWADWCDLACFSSFPAFQQAFDRWADRVAFVSVDYAGNPEEAETRLKAGGYTFPVVNDSSGEIGEAWGVEGVPVWVLLDAEGRVIEVRIRPQTVEELNKLLATAVE
ncbi:MAG: redoxin domain-containing protein [Dehalococcoidia bacterium]